MPYRAAPQSGPCDRHRAHAARGAALPPVRRASLLALLLILSALTTGCPCVLRNLGPAVSLQAIDPDFTERDGSVLIAVRLDCCCWQDTHVTLRLGGTAQEGVDYTCSTTELVIPAGQTTGHVTLAAIADDVHEGDETVEVTIESVACGCIAEESPLVLTLAEDDPSPTLRLLADRATLAEPDGRIALAAELSRPCTRDVSVTLLFAGSARRDADYTCGADTLVIPAGSTRATTCLASLDDNTYEIGETISVTPGIITGAKWHRPAPLLLAFQDDDPPPRVRLRLEHTELFEYAGATVAVVSLSEPAECDVRVGLACGGTAQRDTDYALAATQVVISAGQTTAGVSLVAWPDTIHESDETIVLAIDSVENGVEDGIQQAVAIIADANTAPTVRLTRGQVRPGEAGGTTTITATLSEVSGRDVIVDLAWAGRAVRGVDYTCPASRVVIPAGSLAAGLTLTGLDDAVHEQDETVIVSIASTVFAVENGIQQVTAVLVDDDPPPLVTLSCSNTLLAEGGPARQVTATLSAVCGLDVTAYLGLVGTARAGADYTCSATKILIPAGQLSGGITIASVNDLVQEQVETLRVRVDFVSHAAPAGSPVTLLLQDNDHAGVIVNAADGILVAEQGPTTDTYTITLESQPAGSVVITVRPDGQLDVSEGPGVARKITFTSTNWNQPQTVTVRAVDDAIDEPDPHGATIVHTVSSGDSHYAGAIFEVSVLVEDNDSPAVVNLAAAGSPLAEEGGIATVTATLSTVSDFDVMVTLGLGGEAEAGIDYTCSGTEILIPAGAISGTVSLAGRDDAFYEGDEPLTVEILAVANGVAGGSWQASLLVADDDPAPGVALGLSGSPVAENGGQATVRATLSAVSSLPVTVNLGFGGTAGAGDYVVSDGSIVIPPGSVTGTITIAAVADSLYEDEETVVVDIASVDGGSEIGDQQVTATIADDDPPPAVTLSVAGSPLAENGGLATITAAIPSESGLPVTVTLSLGGAAAAGVDYACSDTQIVIPAGNTTASVTITGIDDVSFEQNEAVTIDIAAVTGGIESGNQQVTAMIADDEPAPTVALSLVGSPLVENGGTAVLTATLSAACGLDVTVALEFGGTASLSADYTAASQIVIPAGSTTAGIVLAATDDSSHEGDETITIDIVSVTHAVEDGTQQVAAAIDDDDPASVLNLEMAGSPLAEDGGVASIAATLSAPAGLPVTVDLAFAGTAVVGSDYTRSAAQIIIDSGETSGVITITGLANGTYDSGRTVIVSVAGATNAVLGATTEVTATIGNTDPSPTVTLSVAGSPLSENGGVATVTAMLAAASDFDATIGLTFAGTAGRDVDYTAAQAQILIPAGSTVGSATLTGLDDALYEAGETIVVDIATTTHCTESTPQQVTVTIASDDPPPTVTLAIAGSPIAEAGGTATVTATLSAVSGLPTTVFLSFGGTAVLSTDYTRSGTLVTIPAGGLNGSITLSAVPDALFQGNQTVIVSVNVVTNGIEDGVQQVTATIVDDDVPGVTIDVGDGVHVIETGNVTDTYTVVLRTPPVASVTITATPDSQLDMRPGIATTDSVTFTTSNWSVPQTFTVRPVQDGVVEGLHTGTITHTATSLDPNYNGIAIAGVTATISD